MRTRRYQVIAERTGLVVAAFDTREQAESFAVEYKSAYGFDVSVRDDRADL